MAESLHRLRYDHSDEAAWRVLFETSWSWVSATAIRELRGSYEVVEDVRQQVFMSLCTDPKFPGEIDSVARYRAYLSVVTRNASIDYWRQFGRQSEAIYDGTAEHADSSKDAGFIELREDIRRAVDELSEADQFLIDLVMEDVPRAEMARELGQSTATVAVRLHRIRQKLRKVLADKGLDYPEFRIVTEQNT